MLLHEVVSDLPIVSVGRQVQLRSSAGTSRLAVFYTLGLTQKNKKIYQFHWKYKFDSTAFASSHTSRSSHGGTVPFVDVIQTHHGNTQRQKKHIFMDE